MPYRDEDVRRITPLTAMTAENRWFDAGVEISAIEAGGAPQTQGASWIEIMMQLTGVNRDMLRRMQRNAAFVSGIDDPLLRHELKLCPLSHVDFLVRASAIDINAGKEMIERYRSSGYKNTYRGLLAEYDSIRESKAPTSDLAPKTNTSAAVFVRKCLEMSSDQRMPNLYRAIAGRAPSRMRAQRHLPRSLTEIVIPSPSYLLHRRGEIGWQDDAPTGIDGVHCWHQHRTDTPDVAKRKILQAATEATMFDVLWIFLPEGLPETYEKHAETLALTNVGIVRVDTETWQPRLQRTPTAPPLTDRRQLWSIWQEHGLHDDASAEEPAGSLKI